jgi:hypothetical protein
VARSLQPCGTNAAYKRHLRHGEDCGACREANGRRSAGARGTQDEIELFVHGPIRSGLPFRPYVYRGTGEDVLTGHLDDELEAAS